MLQLKARWRLELHAENARIAFDARAVLFLHTFAFRGSVQYEKLNRDRGYSFPES